MRTVCAILALTGIVSPLPATTLIQLSMTDLIQKSTSIERVQVTSSWTALQGGTIYTYYQLQVIETLKPGGALITQVAVPGGVAGGVRQSVAGAPSLTTGGQYVIFLWTGRSGLTQVIGLSQGLFSVGQDASGNPVLVRSGATSMVLDNSGNVVNDQGVTISLSALKSQIQQLLGAGN